MRLTSFRVERFRNVLDSGDVPIDDRVTCLVGKNESGKTNLLHALDALNAASAARVLTEYDYPRWLQKAHQRSGEFEAATPIRASFELTDEEVEDIEGLYGSGVLASPAWTLLLKYDGGFRFTVEVDEAAACRAIEHRHGMETGAANVTEFSAALDELAQEMQTDSSGAEVQAPKARQASAARAELVELYGDSTVSQVVGQALMDRMPQFFYFDDYSQLRGRTELTPILDALRNETVGSLTAEQRTALALLHLGYASTELVDPNYETRSSEMEAVAADLTRQVLRYWHQNDRLRLEIDVESIQQQAADGTHIVNQYLQLRVMDERHFFTNSLDVRSSGFRWFVSFLAAFTDFQASEHVIVLLDEPALGLHARAQADFLAFIDQALADRHQVIYTTHSPFMVDAGHLERVRVVEDHGPDEGVQVKTQLMSRDPDTLSPLQGALGYDLAQNIFVGPDNLVVEGLADHTYLLVLSEALRGANRTTLDPRWRVLPAGGAGRIPAAVSLLGRELDVTVVLDGASAPPQRVNDLATEGLLDRQRIITVATIVGMRSADVEDLFDPEDYLSIYNAACGQALSLTELVGGTDRILARIERNAGTFNHNDPANWLLDHRSEVVPTLRATTLDRFERLFQAINGTLG